MTMMEKQAELGRKLFEINMSAASELIKTQQEGLKTYFESNSEYGRKLPEIKDLATAMEMSKEYSETMYATLRTSAEAQASIVKSAMEEAGAAMQASFSVAA